MSMKKAKIYAVIGSLFLSLNVAYAADLVVWEDIGKAHGIEKAVAQFEKENNCKVILKDSDYVGHLTAYEKAVKDGSQIPDVLMLPADRVGSAAKDGLIAPLSFMKNEEQKYLQSSISAFTYQGNIYAVPRSMETMVVYYNQDLIKYPFEHFEDYYKLSKELKAKGIRLYNKEEAEWCKQNNIPYDGVDYKVYKSNDYYYEFKLIDNNRYHSVNVKFIRKDRFPKDFSGKSHEEIAKACKSVDDIYKLKADIRCKLMILLHYEPMSYLNFVRNAEQNEHNVGAHNSKNRQRFQS